MDRCWSAVRGWFVLQLECINECQQKMHCDGLGTPAFGMVFPSQKEANRWGELLLLQRAGEIKDLAPHPRFELVVNGKKVGVYTGDAAYFDTRSKTNVVEEAKGYKVRDYTLRRNLFIALHPTLEHREV